MKLNDGLSGLLILILGAAVAAHARTFPSVQGQSIGPAVFPTLIGCGLALLGAGLMVSAARQPDRTWIRVDEWMRRPRMVLNFMVVVASLVIYALVVDHLGFFITGFIFVGTLLSVFGAKLLRALPLAAIVTLVIHYVFYTLLHVPLPWGLLEAIAW